MTSKYAILMETSHSDCESWYYFIQYRNNEEALKSISRQLELIQDLGQVGADVNFFDIDIDNLVSETCVDEMILLELNSVSYHRKFHGILEMIDFKFRDTDNDSDMVHKVFDTIGDNLLESFNLQ
jgi:hypothetical protein